MLGFKGLGARQAIAEGAKVTRNKQETSAPLCLGDPASVRVVLAQRHEAVREVIQGPFFPCGLIRAELVSVTGLPSPLRASGSAKTR